ncbi:MAG: GDP-mannose 4,6-dehydratase [Bryobacteraceae bacterium]
MVDENFYRPAEVDLLVGDATKAKKTLGWEPHVRFHDLVREMVREDLRASQQALVLAKA